MNEHKPEWWPRNPYPKEVFPMTIEQYKEVVPDPELRTAISGMFGHYFFELMSSTFLEKMEEFLELEVEERVRECVE